MSRKGDQEEQKALSFEKAVQRLEEIVERLEKGDVPLDDALTLFEEGVRLSRDCNARLDEIERKIELLTDKRDAKGEPVTEPFDEEAVD